MGPSLQGSDSVVQPQLAGGPAPELIAPSLHATGDHRTQTAIIHGSPKPQNEGGSPRSWLEAPMKRKRREAGPGGERATSRIGDWGSPHTGSITGTSCLVPLLKAGVYPLPRTCFETLLVPCGLPPTCSPQPLNDPELTIPAASLGLPDLENLWACVWH